MDIFYATVVVIWTMTGQSGIVDRSEPLSDLAACERTAAVMLLEAAKTYGELPVRIEPRCELWRNGREAA